MNKPIISILIALAAIDCGGGGGAKSADDAKSEFVSGRICAKDGDKALCDVAASAPEPVKTPFETCVRAMADALKSKDWGAAASTCETAGKLITDFMKSATDADQKVVANTLAAGAYDFAGLAYESATESYSLAHCKMIGATYNRVINTGKPTAIPSMTGHYSAAIGECRKRHPGAEGF